MSSRHRMLFAMLLCAACDSKPGTSTAPTAPNPAGGAFVASGTTNPIYVGYGSKVTPESSPQSNFSWGVMVRSTGSIRGTIQRVDAKLSDRATSTVLGTSTHIGPFLNIRDPRIPNQIVDPLLETGVQTFNGAQEVLGFVGNPANLDIDVATSQARIHRRPRR